MHGASVGAKHTVMPRPERALMSCTECASILSVELLKRWWIRVLLYAMTIAAVAWTAYHLAYRHSCGVRCGDSDADMAIFDGLVWAAGMSAIVLCACAVFEAVVYLRRPSE